MPLTRARNIALWFLKPFYGRDQYWQVVTLCFTAATTFWLLNALNKNYTNIRVTYPIRFLYNQQQYIPLKPLPEEVTINVSGKGWKLLRKYLMLDVRPADIPVQDLIQRRVVPATIFRANIANALDGLELNFVVTDSIRFVFDRQVKRKIPLALDTTHLSIDANYTLVKPITITPAEVEFEGPASVLDSLPNPFLLKISETQLKQPYRSAAPLNYPFKDLIKSDIVEAEIAFDIQPLNWQNIILAPALVNAPASGNIALQPATINVRYGFVADQAAQINPTQFVIKADLARLNPTDSTLTVELEQKPGAAQRVRLQPTQVKVKYTPK